VTSFWVSYVRHYIVHRDLGLPDLLNFLQESFGIIYHIKDRHFLSQPAYCIIHYLCKAHTLLRILSGLSSKYFTFCPHTVFVCFVWISEQTAIISLYNVNGCFL